MMHDIRFWIAKTLAEVLIWLVVVGCILLVAGVIYWREQRAIRKKQNLASGGGHG